MSNSLDKEVYSADDTVVAPKPLKSMKSELEQLNMFYNDFEKVAEEYPDLDYEKELCDLRDKTTCLMSDYSALYAKILTDNPDKDWRSIL